MFCLSKIRLFLFLLIFNFFCPVNAQEIIRGKILDINSHQPIPYVNIFLARSQRGTVSDFAGKFQLKIPAADSLLEKLIIQHINYDRKEISLQDLQSPLTIYLQPRVIALPGVEIYAPGEKFEIKKDLPLIVNEIKARQFDIRGFIDAGDFLRADESIQVQENLSGSKTISLRGGNADDVLILYNGVKLNNPFTNIFDMSLIDLEDVNSLQIIKGSNSILYGTGAFSGVINVIPQIEQDYFLRFQQRIGSYNSGNWGVQIYGKKNNLHATYRIRQGAARRNFIDGIPGLDYLENRTFHQFAGLEYRFGKNKNVVAQNRLTANFLKSNITYSDHRTDEKISNANRLFQIQYRGDIGKFKNISISLASQKSDEKQSINHYSGWLERNLSDRSFQIHAEKNARFPSSELVFLYQFNQNSLDFSDARLDYLRNQISGEIDKLQRTQHSLASVMKIHQPGGSNFLRTVDFDLSYRFDFARDRQPQAIGENAIFRAMPERTWKESTLKFASRFHGFYQRFLLDIFVNIGNNVKLPALAQLISSQIMFEENGKSFSLKPEKNNAVEIGIILKRDLRDQPEIYGWEISLSYMKNHYSNKLRPYYIVGLPLAFYDNVADARISGVETKAAVFLFKKKVTVETGISRYNITEKAAFPFKADYKIVANLKIEHSGYSFWLHWFHESEQIGWVRQVNGLFSEVTLPKFSNVDLHFSKMFPFWKFKLFANVSLRNLLSDKTQLMGLALHDRRYYVTVGVQY